MKKEMEKIYDPKQSEKRIYKFWSDNGYFRPEVDPDKKPYTIVMPPPNITGQLHLGHALDNVVQDIFTRWRRMQGYSALWLPGTDHASIATEAKIVEQLRSEGVDKADLGREKFLERAWEWKEKYGNTITSQLRLLGSSCDWSRERFTMDEGCSEAVVESFVRLYEKGLIYKGERIVNWCPHCKTSISDAEVEFEESEGNFWHLSYPLADGSGSLIIATTRPETMLGDTAVAVHPDDERYAAFVGKNVILPLVGREIPVIADTYVERDFGTGALKITPAHDPNDFELGARHNLPIINIFDDSATVNENGGKYAGLERYAARKAILKDLEAAGALVKTQPHTHNVGSCYRCSATVEPWISKQWFVKMEPLAKPAIKAVRERETKFVPERFEKIYFNWMENIKDWCISRQLWWGHQIPAWYCADCGEVIVARTEPEACPHCRGENLTRDPDTLDTWFSSALWPFSTLGWPEKTPDLEYFYPTNTLVTAYDIIFFWVARMIFSGIEQMGEVPFDTVVIHGIVRDALGRKMSKSLGNGLDPIELIELYGADSLRFTLVNGISMGGDTRFSEEKIISGRNFTNKLWNAARFIDMNLEEGIDYLAPPERLEAPDRWILAKLDRLITEVTDNLEKYEIGVAAAKLYEFSWDVFCDWYVEISKPRLFDPAAKTDACRVLVKVMDGILKLLHPFIPFITEEIWQTLPHSGETVMLADWPSVSGEDFSEEERNFEEIVTAVKALRNARAQLGVPPSKKAKLFIDTRIPEVFKAGEIYFQKLAGAAETEVGTGLSAEGMKVSTETAVLTMPLEELLDREKELERLEKEKADVSKDIAFLDKKLGNEGYTSKAPEKVVQEDRIKLERAKEKLQNTLASIEFWNK